MNEKQVILSKTEFDNMEQEIDALKKTVENKTVVTIFRHRWNEVPYNRYGVNSYLVGTQIEYVMGMDENEIVKTLSEEIKDLRKNNEDYIKRNYDLSTENNDLKKSNKKWKNLPWYKRLLKQD